MAKVAQIYDQPDGSVNKNQVVVPTAGGTLVGTTDTQTMSNKTLTSPVVNGATWTNCPVNVATIAAAGSNFATANAIATAYPAFIFATGADGSKGISLPVAVAGMSYTVKNQDSDNAILKVYPVTNSTINGTANTAISMAANTQATFFAYNATTWLTAKVPA